MQWRLPEKKRVSTHEKSNFAKQRVASVFSRSVAFRFTNSLQCWRDAVASLHDACTARCAKVSQKKSEIFPFESDIKLGPQTHIGAESQSEGTIQLVPKP